MRAPLKRLGSTLVEHLPRVPVALCDPTREVVPVALRPGLLFEHLGVCFEHDVGVGGCRVGPGQVLVVIRGEALRQPRPVAPTARGGLIQEDVQVAIRVGEEGIDASFACDYRSIFFFLFASVLLLSID